MMPIGVRMANMNASAMEWLHMDELTGEAARANGFARLDDAQLAALGQPRHAVIQLIL